MKIANKLYKRILVLILVLTGALTLNGSIGTLRGHGFEIHRAIADGSKPLGPSSGEAFARSDLFFGTATPNGASVTDAEWSSFLDGVITPRFPDGLTVVRGLGQFKDASGAMVQEKAFILILLYPNQNSKSSSDHIEAIRQAYKERFHQQSVLRMDYPSPVRVSF